MTYDEAQEMIGNIVREMPALNDGDPWLVKIKGIPVEAHLDGEFVLDDGGEWQYEWGDSTGGYWVEVAWYCWVRNSKTDIPQENGMSMALHEAATTAAVYVMLEDSYQARMEKMRTFRSRREALVGVFT